MKQILILLIASLLMGAHTLGAQSDSMQTDLPTGEFGEIEVSRNAEVLLDPTRLLSLADVRTRPFKKREGRPLNFGFTKNAIWVHFHLLNPEATQRSALLLAASALAEDVQLHVLKDGREIAFLQEGNARPFAMRSYSDRATVFRLSVLPGDNEYFMRVAWDLRTNLPMRLYSPEAFHQWTYREQLIQGIYFGILFVAMVYNFFLFLSIRDRSYLAYVGYVMAMALVVAAQSGYAFQYLWSESVWWNKHSHTFLASVLGAISCVFATEFLNLRIRSGKLAMGIHALAAISLIVGFSSFILPLLVMAPILNTLLLTICLVLTVAGIRSLIAGYRPAIFYLLAFTLLLITSIVFLLNARGLIVADRWITYSVQAGSALEIVILSLGLGDRINLMRARNATLEREAIARAAEIKRMEWELETARRIQQAILPHSSPQLPGLRVATRYEPMQAVGGDFYDFYPISDSVLAVLIADVSGHGVPAALIASMLKVACAEQVAFAGKPDLFLSTVNRSLLGKQSDQFITAGFGVIDRNRLTLSYANAGHPPLLIYSEGKVHRLRPLGRIIGIFEEPGIAAQSFQLKENDRIVFYTDGVVEAFGRDETQFGVARLEEHILRTAEGTPEELCESLLKALRDWSPTREFDDDVTIVVVDLYPGV